jgi:hypothetical protein
MSSATDAPLVETTVPAEGQTPPHPALRPQPTPLATRRITPDGAGWTVLVFATAGGAIAAAFILRATAPDLRDLITFGGLGLLLTFSLIGLVLGRLP